MEILWVFVLFEGIGIYFIIQGRKEIKKNETTDLYGKFVYGKITKLSHTGAYVNNVPEIAAHILVYLPSNGTTKEFVEKLGIGVSDYEINDYVSLKQYEDDVNIISIINPSKIPDNIKAELDQKISSYSKKATIVIDGIEYEEADNE